jgi:hypothetical protein
LVIRGAGRQVFAELQIRASRQRLEQSFDFALDQIADNSEVVRRAIFEGGSAPNAFGDDAK